MGPAAPPQAPAGHVNLDQSTLATGKKHHVGERESFGSGVICGGGNLASLEECHISDIVFFTTITLERWLLAFLVTAIVRRSFL